VDERANARRLAVSTAIFSGATGLSRLLGLVREIVVANYFGARGSINAFTIAFQIPNLIRALVADAALSSAFVPVFSELLEKGEKARAWRVASTIFWLFLLVGTGLTALFILIAPWVMKIFGYGGDAVGFARVLHNPMIRPERLVSRLVEETRASAELMRERQAQHDKHLLQDIILSDGLTPVYQPLYNLRTGTVVGYEGLVRPAEAAGFPNASALFVAAEAAGRTVELDLASLETVLAGAKDLDESQYLSVNLSPRSLEAPAFSAYDVLSIARRYGIDATRLVVELTEREEVEDLDKLRAALAALRRHGVRTAADDVGAGNAGLRLLSEVSFDIMKIDLTLVRAGAASESADAVLRALRGLARRQRQTIVAEGVETLEELALVMDLGFDMVQGYLLQRPAPHLAAKTLDFDAFRDVRDADPRAAAGAA